MSPLVECLGLQLGKFWIPPFTLEKGELVGLVLNMGRFDELSSELVGLLSKRKSHPALIVHQPLTFVDYFRESFLRDKFWPTTVKEYIRSKGNKQNQIAEKIYEQPSIKPSTPIQRLPATTRKELSMYVSLSHSDKLVFDLRGIDPMGAVKIFEIVKQIVGGNGAAILLDNFDDPEAKQECTKYIQVELRE